MGSIEDIFDKYAVGWFVADKITVKTFPGLTHEEGRQVVSISGHIPGRRASKDHGEHQFHYHTLEHHPDDVDSAIERMVQMIAQDHPA